MLDDLGQPSAADLGRTLDVHPRTVRRWIAADCAPRAVLAALFWLTRWGASQVNADAHNAATLHAGMAATLRREIEALQRELAHVVALGQHDSANAPLWRALPAPRAPAGPRAHLAT